MRAIVFAAAAALSLTAGWACADAMSSRSPKTVTICLDPGGRTAPVTCPIHDASRLNSREDICSCPGATQQVSAPVCAPGMHPPEQSAAYEEARSKAVSHGSLVGAMWRGQPMCEAPRNRGR
jgi:hypothetical protein